MLQAVNEHVRVVASRLGHIELAAYPDHGERVRQLVTSVPPAVWHKVSGRVATRFHNLEERYGRPVAIAILSAGIVGTAVPLPGTTLVAMAPFIALAELHHQLHATGGASLGTKIHLLESEIPSLGRQLMQDVAGALKEE
jgi:hypothetical protein